jgi:RHS repeat-associated protein
MGFNGALYKMYLVDYRFGFNGMHKDNEVKGVGNSLDFGARVYDSRLGRWLSLDPLQAKYPSLSPYNFSVNCPIMFNDPDGRDAQVAITRNSEGGGSITLSSTVYVTGPNAACMVEESQQVFDNWKGKDGKTSDGKFNVHIKITYKVATTEDISRIRSNACEQSGDNLINATMSPGSRAYSGIQSTDYSKSRKGKITGSGNQASLASNDNPRTVIHETLHDFGLGDRYADAIYQFTNTDGSIGWTTPSCYPMEGFENDMMYSGWGFNQIHYDNIAKSVLKVATEKGTDNFVIGRKLDNCDGSGTAANVSKLPQTFEQGGTKYSAPKSKVVR